MFWAGSVERVLTPLVLPCLPSQSRAENPDTDLSKPLIVAEPEVISHQCVFVCVCVCVCVCVFVCVCAVSYTHLTLPTTPYV